MPNLFEPVPNVTVPEPVSGVSAVTASKDDAAPEARLTKEIADLWANHSTLTWHHKANAARIRQIRRKLAERLFDMKTILSQPDAGRAGRWTPWLLDMAIPRSTADRLAARHAETMFGDEELIPCDMSSDPQQIYAEKMAKLVWSHAMVFLTSHECVVQFITHILTEADVVYEEREEGLFIPNPVPEDAAKWESSHPAIRAIPQPGEEGSAGPEKPGEAAADGAAIAKGDGQ